MDPHPLALPNRTGPCYAPSPEDFARALEASRASPRRRMILPVQRTDAAPVQRLINFLQPGTYIRPHRHPCAGASETVCVLAGALGAIIFHADGTLDATLTLTPGGPGSVLDLEPGTWHTMVALLPDTVMLELKRGPYDPATDKDFAPWAPAEHDPSAATYLANLIPPAWRALP